MDIQKLTLKDKIDIILNEYNIVRDEQVHNLTSGKVILSLFISVLVGFVGFILQSGQHFLFMFVPSIVVYYFSWESSRQHCLFYGNAYLSALEERINELAGEKLLFWAHETSFERYFFGKFRFKHKGKSVTSLNPIYLIPNGLLHFTLFIYGLAQGCKWLIANAGSRSPTEGYFWAFIYAFGHVLFLILVLYDMLVQRKKVTDLIEQMMKDKFSENR